MRLVRTRQAEAERATLGKLWCQRLKRAR